MAFNISKYAETLERSAPAEGRDIESITAEIIQRKKNAGREILAIGNCLIEAKAMLSHGEWSAWLEERVEFSERTATRFMRLAREWSNQTALSDLGATKALTLLALPPEEREMFMEENNVVDMTSRELEKAIRERDEARRAAETAQADARSAEESRAKMEADMAVLKRLHESAQENETQAREALAKAQAELKELRARPVDVALEVDQKALEEARKEAVAEMQQKLAWAERERDRAEKELLKVTKALNAAKKTTGAQSAIGSDGDLASFKLLFDQAQTLTNQMHGILLKVRGKDTESAGKLQKAMLAFSENVRRCAE